MAHFTCVRCTRLVKNEECYIIFNRPYCRACDLVFQKDPEYFGLLKKQYQVDKMLMEKFRQIEN